MLDEKHMQLIEMLKKKTTMNEAVWVRTNRDTEFKLVFKKGAITIDKWDDNEEPWVTHIDFNLYNEDGESIDYIRSSDHSDSEDYEILISLYDVVKRKYLKVDETIDSLYKELDQPGVVGENEYNKDGSETDFEDIPF